MKNPFETFTENKIADLVNRIENFSGDKKTLGYVGLKQELRAARDFLQSFRIEQELSVTKPSV